MAATDARPVPQKNVAYRAYFPILDADGDPVSGAASLDSEVSKDGAAFADCTNEATEIGTSGIYYLDLTSGEMNADATVVQVKTATAGAKTTVLVLYPEETGDIRVNATQVNSATPQTAADFAAAANGNPHTGTAQAGAASSITLTAGASAVTDFYKGALVRLTGGTGAGQRRFCTAYNGTTKVATVDTAWAVTPDNTTTYEVL